MGYNVDVDAEADETLNVNLTTFHPLYTADPQIRSPQFTGGRM